MSSTIVEFTTATGGTGKSYYRCAYFILTEFLAERDENFVLWSNYPIKFEPWKDKFKKEQPGLIAMAKDMLGVEEDEVRNRVRVFPDEEVKSWERLDINSTAVRGPWSFFEENEISISETHIAIDECHRFCRKNDKHGHVAWETWLGEIRHEGATIEFLTQSPGKVGSTIKDHSDIQRQLLKSGEMLDPYFQISMNEWYNLGTVFGHKYSPAVWSIKRHKDLNDKFVVMPGGESKFRIEPKYFGCYNTHSESSGGRSGSQRKEPYQKFSKFGVVMWFLRRNFGRLVWNKITQRVGVILLLFLMVFNIGPIINFMIDKMRSSTGKSESPSVKQVEPITSSVSVASAQAAAQGVAAPIPGQQNPDGTVQEFVEVVTIPNVVGFLNDQVIFSNGMRVRAGESILGKVIESIDFEKRVVHFEGGDVRTFVVEYGMSNRVENSRVASPQVPTINR